MTVERFFGEIAWIDQPLSIFRISCRSPIVAAASSRDSVSSFVGVGSKLVVPIRSFLSFSSESTELKKLLRMRGEYPQLRVASDLPWFKIKPTNWSNSLVIEVRFWVNAVPALSFSLASARDSCFCWIRRLSWVIFWVTGSRICSGNDQTTYILL